MKIINIQAIILIIVVSSSSIKADNIEVRNISKGKIFLDQKESLQRDYLLTAKSTGHPVDIIKKGYIFQSEFNKYAEKLLTLYPSQISSIYMEPIPSLKGHIRFVGDVPAEIDSLYRKKQGFIIRGGEKYSREENHSRAESVAKSLHELKYNNVVVYYNPKKNKIIIELTLPKHDNIFDPDSFLANIRSNIEDRIKLSEDTKNDIAVNIITSTGSVYTPLSTRGGSRIFGATSVCTSGWPAEGYGVVGFLTAGHCSQGPAMTNIRDHVNNLIFDLDPNHLNNGSWHISFFNGFGDVGFHATSNTTVLDDFHSDADTITDVSTYRPFLFVGNAVCMYGRSSNERTCGHTINATGVSVTYGGTNFVGNLVRTATTSAIFGDSGGGVSLGTTAWGIISGINIVTGEGYFTSVATAISELDVMILH